MVTPPSRDDLERSHRLKPIPFKPIREGQCLRDAFAACLRVPAGWLPERLEHQPVEAWFATVKNNFGIELRYLHPELDELPPARDEPWIAIVKAPVTAGKTHALAMRNWTITLDPGGYRTGKLLDRLEVRAALRIIGAYGEMVSEAIRMTDRAVVGEHATTSSAPSLLRDLVRPPVPVLERRDVLGRPIPA
jgi:hypothetical protein